MRHLLHILLSLLLISHIAVGQSFYVDSTRFITGFHCCTFIYNAIPTKDKGIFFNGSDNGHPGGMIPEFPANISINDNLMVGKIDSEAHICWIKIYGSSSYSRAIASCQTTDGGFAVLGNVNTGGGDVTGFHGLNDIWLVRLDSAGYLLWEKCFGSSVGSSNSISIANTLDNGFIILGSTNGSNDDVPFHYGSYFSTDWLVIKTDSLGNKQWSKDLGGTGDEATGQGMFSGSILTAPAAIGGYYLVSSSTSTDYDCNDSSWHSSSASTNSNYYILKLDTAGNVKWAKSYGGTWEDDISNAIFDTRDNTIVMTGFSTSTDYIEAGLQHGEGDMLTIKIDTGGNIIWHKSIGGPSQDIGTSIIPGPANGYVIYGSTFPYPDTTMGDVGQTDAWIISIDSNGNVNFEKIFGTVNDELPTSVLPFSNGYVGTGASSNTVSPNLIFSEGTTYGNFDTTGGAFVSYINFIPVNVHNSIYNSFSYMEIFPNPTIDNFILTTNTYIAKKIVITDAIGNIILNSQFYNKTQVSVKGWQKGLYLVKITDETGYYEIQKLIVN